MVLKRELQRIRKTLVKKDVPVLCKNTEQLIVKAIAKNIDSHVKGLLEKRGLNKIILMKTKDSIEYKAWYDLTIETYLSFENDYHEHYLLIESLFITQTK